MIEQIVIRYWSETIQAGFNNVHDAWAIVNKCPVKLLEEDYRGALVFRIPGTSVRIAYRRIKENLTHINKKIQLNLPF